MLIKTRDEQPVSLWATGDVTKRQLRKLTRRTEAHSVDARRVEAVVFPVFTIGGIVVLLSVVTGSSSIWCLLLVAVLWSAAYTTWRMVYEPMWATNYLEICGARGEVFTEDTVAWRLLIPVGYQDTLRVCKQEIDIALTVFQRRVHVPTVALGFTEVGSGLWFLLKDRQNEWRIARDAYVGAVRRQYGDEHAEIVENHLAAAESELREEFAASLDGLLESSRKQEAKARRLSRRLLSIQAAYDVSTVTPKSPTSR